MNLPVPEIIDPVFAKTSQNARFLLSENERFGHVFVKTGSINSGTEVLFALEKGVMRTIFYSVNPVKIYVYEEGLVRFATVVSKKSLFYR
jgi:hypothetical protein